jgi:hypothetical protein
MDGSGWLDLWIYPKGHKPGRVSLARNDAVLIIFRCFMR